MNLPKDESDLKEFIEFRKELHQHPELSGSEFETKKRILQFVKKFQPDETIEVGKTGIIFCFEGDKKGKSILVRSELDALPIQEINDFEHCSRFEGVGHKCGHDGHMVILARLASLLLKNKAELGCVYLLFQPAEENGKGAREVYDDPKFKQLQIDAIIALHNIPGFTKNTVYIREGAMTPAVRSMIVKFKGKTSHAAEPEKGLNPALAMADFIKSALVLSQPKVEDEDFFLVTPVYLQMGEKSYGVSAGYGEVHLTIRSWETELLMEKSEKLVRVVDEISKLNQLQNEISWTEEFQANNNDGEMVDLIVRSAEKLDFQVVELNRPMKWGEDFGLFTTYYKGAMFGLGSGEDHPALHNPDYDFPDDLIESGSDIFYEIIKQFFNEK